jgi:ribosomal protein L11 methyltransferase
MPITATFKQGGENALRQLADAIESEGIGADATDLAEFAPGEWRLIVYFSEAPAALRRRLSQRVAELGVGEAECETFAETDWVKKSLAGLKPVRAGRFLVHGRHDRAAIRANDIAIEIEAGEAFGTGHHGTTAGCLLEIGRIAASKTIRRTLDIGTGSGVLAIAIARLTRAPVLASDIDPVATRVAAANVHLNGAGALIRTITAAGVRGAAFHQHAPYDLVVANILAGPLAALAPEIRKVVAPGGTVVLSGLLPEQGRRIIAAYRSVGLQLERSRVLNGWLTLVLSRPPA